MEERSQILDPSQRVFEVNLEEQSEGRKMRDIGSVLQLGGIKKCSILTAASKEEAISQITNTSSTVHSVPVQIMTSNSSLEPKSDTILSLGLVDSVKPTESLSPKQTKENKSSSGLNLDLNDNPFHPYKNLGQLGSTDASECSSTTGPLEESEPLRMWKAMKKNGFLSSSHGSIPLPKPRGRQPKRRKEEDIKKKIDPMKREQANKYAKIAAPTGLLSGLNPGIIKHVRNSKQVNSIIEAMLQSEKNESQIHNSQTFLSSLENRDNMSESYITSSLYQKSYTIPKFSTEYDDDSLALKLSPTVIMASENPSSANDTLSASQDAIASLSFKGASVASQWLDLLQQDIKGRLAAMKRSKKRVRNVIQTELPYLLAKEMSSNQENEGHLSHSSESGCSEKEILGMHMARWKSIFSQMDKTLYEEGKHLENWLKQVQDIQSHCEGGLKFFGANPNVLLAAECSGLKKSEAVEREHAVRAAAASIYSTCNFITTKTKGNVPCF